MKERKNGHTYLKRLFLAFYIPFAVNIPVAAYVWHMGIWPGFQTVSPPGPAARNLLLVMTLAVTWVIWMVFQIMPKRKDAYASWRVTIMEGGRCLCYTAIYGIFVQVLVLLKVYPGLGQGLVQKKILWAGGIYSVIMLLILLWNGILRIFFTSRRLRLRMRVIMVLAMWVPVVNLLVLLHAMRLVHEEYDFECYKQSVRSVRAESDMCRTRYPLLLVHGVGFRDLRYFNYWGRIPRELARYGAAPMVASLTTINTPHRGCRFVDYACRLPEGLYRFIAGCFDRWFGRFGDSHPDFYTATHQFSTDLSRRFNENVPDMPGVFYQSYTSLMKDCLSDPLLWLPYLLIRAVDGASDGLVTPESAMWGEVRGIVTNRKHRGISHGDMIDLKREDYRGFDVVEFYVKLVEELKHKGF